MKKNLIIICGPTCSGKTAISIQLAKELNTSVISADSRQIYKELNIGVAKPEDSELKQVRHYFIDSKSIHEEFTAHDFEVEGEKILENLFQTADFALVAGGTGLYLKALTIGLDGVPSSDPSIRQDLVEFYNTHGVEQLFEKLRSVDPYYSETVDRHNPQRIIRALEINITTGENIHQREKKNKALPYRIIKIGIDIQREILYEMIDQRVEKMINNGLIEEAKDLYQYRHLNALNTVGYKEMFSYFDHEISLETAILKIKQNTRNYAKRQMTWFRQDKEINWLRYDHKPEKEELFQNAIEVIHQKIELS